MSKPDKLDWEGAKREVRAEVRKIVEESAPLAEAKAPVRTGHLKSSIKPVVRESPKQLRADLQAASFPGIFAERGTKKLAPRPFLDPAFPANDPGNDGAVVERIADAIMRGI